MERYGYLWGKVGKDYQKLAQSEGLDSFLRALGILDTNNTIHALRSKVGGLHPLLNDLKNESELPLAVRYSPVTGPKGSYGVIGVSGVESHRGSLTAEDSRMTIYQAMSFLSHASFAEEKEWNYLDCLFGCSDITPAIVNEYVNQRGSLGMELPPQKQYPVIRGADWNILSQVLDFLYQKEYHRVILKLEPFVNINRRAHDLLLQIYSLLPYKMALDTGYSSYEDPANIKNLITTSPIRIFIVSSSAELPSELLQNQEILILNLGEAQSQNTDIPFDEACRFWAGIAWDRRREAMRVLLGDETAYKKRDYYIEQANDFRNHFFWKWEQSPAKPLPQGNELIQEMFGIYQQVLRLMSIPWIQKRITRKLNQQYEGTALPELIDLLKQYQEQYEGNPSTPPKVIKAFHNLINWLSSMTELDAEQLRMQFESSLIQLKKKQKKVLEDQERKSQRKLLATEKDWESRFEATRAQLLIELEQKEAVIEQLKAENAEIRQKLKEIRELLEESEEQPKKTVPELKKYVFRGNSKNAK